MIDDKRIQSETERDAKEKEMPSVIVAVLSELVKNYNIFFLIRNTLFKRKGKGKEIKVGNNLTTTHYEHSKDQKKSRAFV